MIRRPGLRVTTYAQTAGLDRSTVSHWLNGDAVFQQALEEARSAPLPIVNVEQVYASLDDEQRDRLRALLGRGGNGSGAPAGKEGYTYDPVFGWMDNRPYGAKELVPVIKAAKAARGVRERDELIAEIFKAFCIVGALFHREGFSTDGRSLSSPRQALEGLLKDAQSEVDLTYRRFKPDLDDIGVYADTINTPEGQERMAEADRDFAVSAAGKLVSDMQRHVDRQREAVDRDYPTDEDEQSNDDDADGEGIPF